VLGVPDNHAVKKKPSIKSLTDDNKMLRKENQRLRDLLFVTKQTIAQHEMDYATKWLNKHFPKR
jgi:regulator of replication initiation timing